MPFFLSCFRRCVWLGLAVAVLALSGCSSTRPPEGITPVTPFDLARYEGRWYEVARLDHSFERGMTDVSATYQRQADGSVRVLNRGFDTGKNDWRQAEGKALFTGDANVRNVKAFFATRRAKFGTKVPLALYQKAQAAI